MNQWKISSTCKCNNFAINRTRIMSGNCYVPVTRPVNLPLPVLCCFPACAILAHKINTHLPQITRSNCTYWNFSCDKAHSDDVCVLHRPMEFQPIGGSPSFCLSCRAVSLSPSLDTCVRCYFTESNWYSISFG